MFVSVVAIDDESWFVFPESVEESEAPRYRPSAGSSSEESGS